MSQYTIALAGNPNSGKTTLLNALTGARHKVGNWAGVTVEKKEGAFQFEGQDMKVVDLPGIYSLSPFSLEERVSRSYILDDKPQAIINIVDATAIERNLFLTLQLIELGCPVVVALNMMDEADKRGMRISPEQLSKALGVPVVPIVAARKENISTLIQTTIDQCDGVYEPKPVAYSQKIEAEIAVLADQLTGELPAGYNARWAAIKVIEQDEMLLEKLPGSYRHEDRSDQIAEQKYQYIQELLRGSFHGPTASFDRVSEKIDRVLMHPLMGVLAFMGVMYGVFFATFELGNILLDYIDVFFSEIVSGWALSLLGFLGVAEWMQSLIVDGIIGGVGGVLTFVPNIAIMFIFIGFLEDSGYMARVAYLMDGWMTKVGLNGKTFIPMILGFGCNVPAIMGTRTLDSEKDRMIAILINPFMSCSARMPVYVLFASIFFPGKESVVTYSLYVLGIVVALLMAYIFRNTLFKGEQMPLVMELPPYRMPQLKSSVLTLWDRVRGYLVKAGTVIFAASVLIWFVTNYNLSGPTDIHHSFGAGIGALIAPLLKPLGFGSWEAGLSLLTGLAAKEVIISNMAIVYGFADAEGMGFTAALMEAFTPLAAYAFMVFVLLYTPCVGVIGVIKRETNSWKWTGFSISYQIVVAWVLALLVYQIGHLIGLG